MLNVPDKISQVSKGPRKQPISSVLHAPVNRRTQLRVKASFSETFRDDHSFDSSIQFIFARMLREKKENPSLIIPTGFKEFISSVLFKQLLLRLHQYLETLLVFQRQYEDIAQNTQPHDGLIKMQSEAEILSKKCKEVSYAYIGVLLGHGEHHNMPHDQYFFETMIYLLGEILKETFDQADFSVVEKELNRIFRTSTFNLIKKRHQEDKILKIYPILKEVKYDRTPASVQRTMRRLALHRQFHYATQIKPAKQPQISKPMDINRSPFKSMHSRSPLIASFYPSRQEQLYHFTKQLSEKGKFVQVKQSPRFRATQRYNASKTEQHWPKMRSSVSMTMARKQTQKLGSSTARSLIY